MVLIDQRCDLERWDTDCFKEFAPGPAGSRHAVSSAASTLSEDAAVLSLRTELIFEEVIYIYICIVLKKSSKILTQRIVFSAF